jgi:hypothetical protein
MHVSYGYAFACADSWLVRSGVDRDSEIVETVIKLFVIIFTAVASMHKPGSIHIVLIIRGTKKNHLQWEVQLKRLTEYGIGYWVDESYFEKKSEPCPHPFCDLYIVLHFSSTRRSIIVRSL